MKPTVLNAFKSGEENAQEKVWRFTKHTTAQPINNFPTHPLTPLLHVSHITHPVDARVWRAREWWRRRGTSIRRTTRARLRRGDRNHLKAGSSRFVRRRVPCTSCQSRLRRYIRARPVGFWRLITKETRKSELLSVEILCVIYN